MYYAFTSDAFSLKSDYYRFMSSNKSFNIDMITIINRDGRTTGTPSVDDVSGMTWSTEITRNYMLGSLLNCSYMFLNTKF